jgi:hypothetical protein
MSHDAHDARCSAAVERPHAVEMYDAITKGLCLTARLEMDKRYSRDWMTPGRVRVKLRRRDGELCNTDIPTKSVLLVQCSKLCAKLQDRPRRLEEMKKYEAHLFSGGGAPVRESKASSSAGDKAARGSNKKKGKKK